VIIGKTVEFSDRQLPFPQEFTGIGAPAVSWGSFTITGVIDETRYKSHLKFDVLVSSSTTQSLIAEKKLEDRTNSWEWYLTYTYAMLERVGYWWPNRSGCPQHADITRTNQGL
jgi:putative ABC transport system permease protein